jgi:hypothetical protein
MATPSRKWGIVASFILSLALILACSISTEAPSAAPAFDATKAALELQGTAMSLQLTQSALNSQQQPVVEQPTVPPPAPTQAPPEPTQAPALPTAVPTVDIEAKIKTAKILLYEDTDELGIGQWIQDAIEGMGISYTDTGSFSGHFMEYLNSGVKYDLIIVGAEDRSKITGEFWDVINTRLTRDKAGLIAEVWYLAREYNGPISKVLGPCGVQYRKQYDTADSIYWWQPTHEIFNEPNVVLPLLHYDTYWWTAAGDKLNLGGSGNATMLAGLSAKTSTGEGVLATCYQGRVIIQTFCNHDYRQSDIIALWQNYIHYTLKNHFLATQ